MPKPISCAAYIETIFALFHWDPKYRYRASGVRRQRVEESVLIFDLNETEILIPAEFLDEFRQQNDVSNLEFSLCTFLAANKPFLHTPSHGPTVLVANTTSTRKHPKPPLLIGTGNGILLPMAPYTPVRSRSQAHRNSLRNISHS